MIDNFTRKKGVFIGIFSAGKAWVLNSVFITSNYTARKCETLSFTCRIMYAYLLSGVTVMYSGVASSSNVGVTLIGHKF